MAFVAEPFKQIGKIALEGSRQAQENFKKIRAGIGATGEILNGLPAEFKKSTSRPRHLLNRASALGLIRIPV